MFRKYSKYSLNLISSFALVLITSGFAYCTGQIQKPELYSPNAIDQQIIRDNQASKSKNTGGISFGGIKLDDSAFYDVPSEKCSGVTSAQIIRLYKLKEPVFVFLTKNGYGVAEFEPTLKELETGITRRGTCLLKVGDKLKGKIDCRGVRVIKKEPYKNCAYEARIWSHSSDQFGAFDTVEKLFRVQFGEYRKKCIYKKNKQIKDRLLKF